MTSTEPMTYKPGPEQYRVIKDIPDGWEVSAKVGDILRVSYWEGGTTLMKGRKAVCDADSPYALTHCEKIDSLSALQHVSHTDGLGDRDEMDTETGS